MRRRIVLAPRGSDGDVYPFVSIASALASRGHEVTIATAPVHQNKVERAGIRFMRVRPDFPTPTGLYPEGLFDPKRSVEFFVRRILLPHLEDSYADLVAPCRDADLIVSHPISYATPIIAEQLRTPWVSVVLQPMLFFSTIDPPYVPTFSWLYHLRMLGKWPYAAVWRLQRATIRHRADPIHSLRRKRGLGSASGNPVMDSWQSPMCLGTLAAFSREFAKEQADWPQPTWLTGFVWPESGRTLSIGLRDFLAKGTAPIVFTLGDSSARVPSEFFARSLEAVRRLGCRAIFLTGSATKPFLPELPLEQVFVAEFEPYAQVFPHAAAVVLSGGIGSIGLALRAGRPMLLTPLFFDQIDNAHRSRRMGVARVLELASYTAPAACRELQQLLANPGYAQEAERIGSRIAGENGVETACRRIEALLATRGGN